MCERYRRTDYTASSDDLLLAQSLFFSAVVTYGRTLGSGVRSGVTRDQIRQLSEPLQHRHHYFKDIRDKFVAHSVNAFEENSVKLYLTPEEHGERSVSSIGLGHSRIAALSHMDIAGLQELAVAVLGIVKEEMDRERARLLDFARSLPVDNFYNAPEPSTFSGDSASPAVARKRPGGG
jgi:hypothetical protein